MPRSESSSLHEELVEAACAGDVERVRRLVQRGADPNHRDGLQVNTVLMWAVTHRHRGAAVELLRAGADVNLPDVIGGTPLIVAAGNGDTEMVLLLLEAGADTSHRDDFGNDALAWANHNKHLETAKLLRRRRRPPPDAGDSR